MVSRYGIWAVGFASYLIAAWITSAIGPTLPAILEEFNIDLATGGMVVSLFSLGGVFAFLGGFLSDKIGHARTLSITLFIIAVGVTIGVAATSLPQFGAALVIMGLGIPFLASSVNALVSGIFQERKGMVVNLLNSGWSIGLSISPVVTAFLIGIGMGWRLSYLITAPVSLFLALLLYLTYSSDKKPLPTSRNPQKRVKTPVTALTLPAASVFILGLEIGIVTWIPSILVSQGATLLAASGGIMLFSLLMGVGRIVFSPIIDKMGFRKVITVFAFLTTVMLLAFSLQNNLEYKLVLLALSGMLYGPILPTLLAWVTTKYKDLSGTLSGAVFSFGRIGSFAIVGIIGLLLNTQGYIISQLIYPLLLLILIIYINILTGK